MNIAQKYCIITARFEGIYYTLSFPFPNASFVVVIVVVVERPCATLDRDEGLTINGQSR